MKISQLGALFVLLVVTLLFLGCSGSIGKPPRIACPQVPQMLPVNVKDGTISGQDFDNNLENHTNLWSHIHVIEKLGCTK